LSSKVQIESYRGQDHMLGKTYREEMPPEWRL